MASRRPSSGDDNAGGATVQAEARLVEILVRQHLLGRAKLEAVLADPRLRGHRLAAYLVEQGILTRDQLALGLAEQFGVPPALDADFARADPLLRKRLVVHQAVELQAIPLFLTSHRRVAVAMANPTNPRALERLAFIFGATVDPMVAGEVALTRQFELLYGVRSKRRRRPTVGELPIPHQVAKQTGARQPRAVEAPRPAAELAPGRAAEPGRRPLAETVPARAAEPGRGSSPELGPADAGTGASAAALGTESSEIRPALRSHRRAPREEEKCEPRAPLRLAPLDPDVAEREPGAPVEVMADALCFTPTPLTFIPPVVCEPPLPSRLRAGSHLTPVVVPITSAGAQLAVEQIRFAADQQDLSDNLFTFMRTCFAVGALFVVGGAEARGRFGFSFGEVRPAVEGLHFSLSLPSCFRIARARRSTFRGTPPPDGMAVHGPLWTALATEQPNDVLVSPVIVDGHVTLLLYAQSVLGHPISGLAASKMAHVCEALSSSLVRLAV